MVPQKILDWRVKDWMKIFEHRLTRKARPPIRAICHLFRQPISAGGCVPALPYPSTVRAITVKILLKITSNFPIFLKFFWGKDFIRRNLPISDDEKWSVKFI